MPVGERFRQRGGLTPAPGDLRLLLDDPARMPLGRTLALGEPALLLVNLLPARLDHGGLFAERGLLPGHVRFCCCRRAFLLRQFPGVCV